MDRIEKELNLLRRISSLFLAEQARISLEMPEPSQVLDRLVDEVARAMEADAATIFLRDDSMSAGPETSFIVRATRGLDGAAVGATRIRPGEGLAGHSIREGRIISVADGPADARYVYKKETGEERYKGFLAAPIIRGEEVLGILVLHFLEARAASTDEIRLIAALAEQLGFALENARLYTELQERMGARTHLYEMSRAITGLLDPRSVFQEIAERARRIIHSRAAILRIFDITTNRLMVEAAAGDYDRSMKSMEPQTLGESVAGEAARSYQPVVVHDLARDPRGGGYLGMTSLLAVPLIHQNQVVGTLELLDKHSKESGRPQPFTVADERLLAVLAQIAAESYSKAEIYAEMEAIALTYKRKNHELMILNRLSREIQGSTAENEILAVILTGITSGHGLAYNRALVLLMDEQKQELRGAMGIGPGVEEVNRVWTEAPERFHTLEDYLLSADSAEIERSSFHQAVRKLRVPITGEPSLIARVISERRGFNIRSTAGLLGSDRVFASSLRSSSYAMVPVCTKDLVIGLIAVDNIFNQKPIMDEDLVLLQTIANQCGLALDGARMVEELSTAMKRLEVMTGRLIEAEKLAAIGEMAAGIAHDIRNPLTAIGGFTRRLGKRLPPSDSGHRYVEIIEHEVERLEKLCTEVLQLASSRDISRSTVDVMELVRNWKARNETHLRRKKVAVALERDSFPVHADGVLLDQALSNILGNAYDAVEQGGEIRCLGEISGGGVWIRVRDNGCGMTPEEINQAFEAFYTTKTEGTGLGLALARKAITAHNGEISVESRPGKGTTFSIFLPGAAA